MADSTPRIYHLAFFTANGNQDLLCDALETLTSCTKTYPFLRIHVFNSFGFSQRGQSRSSQYKIFELPDFSLYDGAIIQSHQFTETALLHALNRRIHEAGIPVLSVGAPLANTPDIGTDNYAASAALTEHLVTEHRARSFLYLKGMEGDGCGEAWERRRAFEDVLERHQIPKEHIRFEHGEWQSWYSHQAVRKVLEEGGPLPDAIVAANDEMAFGAMDALYEAGIRVPEDVLVAGFDDTFNARLSKPRLTTISRDFHTMIRTAVELMIGRLRGEAIPDRVISPFQPVFSGSCGCPGYTLEDYISFYDMFSEQSLKQERFYHYQSRLTSGLYSASTLSEVLDTLERNAAIFSSPQMYLFLNDFYFDHFSDPQFGGADASRFSDRFVLAAVSGFTLPRGEDGAYLRGTQDELLCSQTALDLPFCLFYPLHFSGVTLGTLVLTEAPGRAEVSLHENIINLFVFALENVRQRILSARLNERLNALSVTDRLTGLYNRFGYDQYGKDLFRHLQSSGRNARVLFIDVDNMKAINDVHGHATGDEALKLLSEVIRESTRATDFRMRFGGDEFVVITDSDKGDIAGRIEEKLKALNASGSLPYVLEVSIGESSAQEGVATLEDMLSEADERMYEIKKLRKR